MSGTLSLSETSLVTISQTPATATVVYSGNTYNISISGAPGTTSNSGTLPTGQCSNLTSSAIAAGSISGPIGSVSINGHTYAAKTAGTTSAPPNTFYVLINNIQYPIIINPAGIPIANVVVSGLSYTIIPGMAITSAGIINSLPAMMYLTLLGNNTSPSAAIMQANATTANALGNTISTWLLNNASITVATQSTTITSGNPYPLPTGVGTLS
jgi:hypothetical protein